MSSMDDFLLRFINVQLFVVEKNAAIAFGFSKWVFKRKSNYGKNIVKRQYVSCINHAFMHTHINAAFTRSHNCNENAVFCVAFRNTCSHLMRWHTVHRRRYSPINDFILCIRNVFFFAWPIKRSLINEDEIGSHFIGFSRYMNSDWHQKHLRNSTHPSYLYPISEEKRWKKIINHIKYLHHFVRKW